MFVDIKIKTSVSSILRKKMLKLLKEFFRPTIKQLSDLPKKLLKDNVHYNVCKLVYIFSIFKKCLRAFST